MISWVKNASSLENSMGTIKYMLIFFMNSILIQIIYCLLLLIGFLISRNKKILTENQLIETFLKKKKQIFKW